MKYTNQFKSKDYMHRRMYDAGDFWNFASDFHYNGSGFTDERNFYGELWCESTERIINKNEDEEITVRCWYKSHTSNFAVRSSKPDIVISVIVDPCEPGCFPIYSINHDVLKWNTELADALVYDKLSS